MNVKPGDMAIVIAGAHAGAICRVVRDATWYWQLGRVMWECEFPRLMQWKFPPGEWSAVGDVPDSKLRRINGPEDEETIPAELQREVPA